MTRTHVLATLTLAGLALAAAAGPASAQQLKVKDARGDVWVSTDAGVATPAPSLRSGDIAKTVVVHGDGEATAKIGFVKLARKGAYAQYDVTFQGSRGGVVREVLLETSRRDRRGSVRVFNAKGQPLDGCDVDHKVSYRRDKVTISIDRRCLNKPGRVRVNVNTAHATGSGVFFSDNLHDTAPRSDAWTDWVKRGR